MEVRELTAADRAEAVAIWASSGLTRPWNDPEADFDRAAAGPASTVLGMFDPELVGTVMVGHDGHRGWVYYLAVDSELRRVGLGRRLMQEAETWLRGRGVVKLNLMVRHTNEGALGFYERIRYADAEVSVLARWL
jgi:ribosomal protein S18 acetylase RimI-like enzyme